jgi:hypothetical protein
MRLNDALTECLSFLNVRIEPGSCLWVMDKGDDTVWIYMETMDGEITSYRLAWPLLQQRIVMKKDK